MITDLRTKSTRVHVYVNESNEFSSVPITILKVGDLFKLPVAEGYAYDINGNDIVFTAQSIVNFCKLENHYHIKVSTDCMVN